MRAFWRHVTLAPDEPIVRSVVKLQDDELIEPVLEEPVLVTGAPVSAALTFAIVALSAPNEERSERMDWTCVLVRPAACAIGARESIDVAIARPVATAATFATAFEVTVVITIVIVLEEYAPYLK